MFSELLTASDNITESFNQKISFVYYNYKNSNEFQNCQNIGFVEIITYRLCRKIIANLTKIIRIADPYLFFILDSVDTTGNKIIIKGGNTTGITSDKYVRYRYATSRGNFIVVSSAKRGCICTTG